MVSTDTLSSASRRLWQRALRRVGWSGLLGAVLALVALGLAVAWPTLQHAADASRVALEHRREMLRRPQAPQAIPLTPQEQAERFVSGFPGFEQNAEDVKHVFAGAERAHVQLLKGDYAIKADAGSPFITYTATFPVKDTYSALKEFTAEVLQSLPHASLDELRMARPDVQGAVLDATIRFTFVYRRP
jgi:hypothetical protein